MKSRFAQFLTIALASFTAFSARPAEPALPTASEALTNRPTASELLQWFAEEQAKLTSFIAQYELTRQDSVWGPQTYKGSYSKSGETRLDGLRLSERTRWWGQVTPDVVRSKADPISKSWLFDGAWLYSYEQDFLQQDDKRAKSQAHALGSLSVRPLPAPVANGLDLMGHLDSGLARLMGLLPHDQARFDLQMRDAASLRVRSQLEPAGAEPSPCYVLEADTPGGRYTAWLDPAHGYQMARAILERQPGHHRAANATLTAGEHDRSTADKIRFAKAGGVWVPMEGSFGLDNAFAKAGTSNMRMRIKVTKFLPNPDHQAQRSFRPDDIRNGAAVRLIGVTNAASKPGKLHWQDGKVLDSEGNVAFDSGLTRTNSINPTPAGKQ